MVENSIISKYDTIVYDEYDEFKMAFSESIFAVNHPI
jgi:hypothetical protein